MVALRTWLRPGAAVLILAGILGLGCGGRGSEPAGYSRVEGTVTYTRLPVAYDADGRPTGLGATGTVTAARGVVVKVFQLFYDVDLTGAQIPTWRQAGTTFTDSEGGYAFSGLARTGYGTMVELESVFQQDGGNGAQVKVVAEPGGIRSTTAEPNRPIYVVRKDPAGNVFTTTDALADPAAVAPLGADSRIDFALGNGTGDLDAWATTVPDWYASGSEPIHQTGVQALGSRILAILDSAYVFSYYYGDPTPSPTKGGVLDLHYYPGVTESPRRSYVVYDPTLLAASAHDGAGKLHYFGTLAGGPTVDDAWDPGVLYALFARSYLAGQGKVSLYPYGQDTVSTLAPDLAPDLALVEGLGDAMAATLIKTPFVTDLSAATGLVGRDIRVAATKGIHSPGNIAALAWRLTLTVHGISTYEDGTPAQWALFDPTYLRRFFWLVQPAEDLYTTHSGTVSARKDMASILGQIQVLYENHGDTPNLSKIFSDDLLIPMLNNASTFGIYWPGTNLWSPVASYWGLDPSGVMGAVPLTLDPALARLVPDPDVSKASPGTVYLNTSSGEVAYARLDLTVDRHYRVSLATTPATLPAGVQVELVVDDNIQEPLLFSAADSTAKAWYLKGNPNDISYPARHWVRIRLLSQDPSLSATPIQVGVNLTPAP
jgi:hypothetical protein